MTALHPKQRQQQIFLSAVVKQIRQDLLTDLLLTVHDAQRGSTSLPAEHKPAHVQEQSDHFIAWQSGISQIGMHPLFLPLH